MPSTRTLERFAKATHTRLRISSSPRSRAIRRGGSASNRLSGHGLFSELTKVSRQSAEHAWPPLASKPGSFKN